MNEHEMMPRETWLEVTPIINDPFGTPIRLQTVRYRITPDIAALYGQGYRAITPGTTLNGYPNSAMSCWLTFDTKVEWADTPTPEPLPTVDPQ